MDIGATVGTAADLAEEKGVHRAGHPPRSLLSCWNQPEPVN